MKMTSELVTLAEAEEDLDEDSDEDDDDEEEDSSHDGDGSKSEMFAFNVPHFRYIDDDDAEEYMDEGRVEEHKWYLVLLLYWGRLLQLFILQVCGGVRYAA